MVILNISLSSLSKVSLSFRYLCIVSYVTDIHAYIHVSHMYKCVYIDRQALKRVSLSSTQGRVPFPSLSLSSYTSTERYTSSSSPFNPSLSSPLIRSFSSSVVFNNSSISSLHEKSPRFFKQHHGRYPYSNLYNPSGRGQYIRTQSRRGYKTGTNNSNPNNEKQTHMKF